MVRLLCLPFLVFLVVGAAPPGAARSDGIDPDRLVTIVHQICLRPEMVGVSRTRSGGISGHVDLNALFGRLATAGVRMEGNAANADWRGIAQADLGRALASYNGCSQAVTKLIVEHFKVASVGGVPERRQIPTAAPARGNGPTANSSVTQPSPPATQIQFLPENYAYGAFSIKLNPCIQSGTSLDCQVDVQVSSDRAPAWWFDRNSALEDGENKIAPTWVRLQGAVYNLANGGRGIRLTQGAVTYVHYHFDNVTDPAKLQTFSLTFCCTRYIPFTRQR